MPTITDLEARDPSTLTRGERRILAQHASRKDLAGGVGGGGVALAAVEAMPTGLLRRGIRRQTLEGVYVALSPDQRNHPDALGRLQLGAKISGLLIDRTEVKSTVVVAAFHDMARSDAVKVIEADVLPHLTAPQVSHDDEAGEG